MGAVGPDALPRSGSRLHAVVLFGEDGSAFPLGWRDEELGVPCRIRPAADGKWRCLPGEPIEPPQEIYSDASCSTPIAVVPAGTRFVERDGEQWRVAAEYSGLAWEQASGGDCRELVYGAPPHVLEHEPASSFVRLAE